MSTRSQLIAKAEQILAQAHTPQPRAEAEFLLAAATGLSRTRLLAFAQETVASAEEEQFWQFIARKQKGEPVAYITGETDFAGLILHSDSRALAPRPETEELAQYCANLFERGANPDILDLCTGTGCLALYLAAKFPRGRVTAVDISEDALRLAAENARLTKLQDRVQFLQSDLFAEVSGTFDLIVSNPPYIATDDITGLSREVHYEPKLALDGGADGLLFYRRIADGAVRHLKVGGRIYLEIGCDQYEDVRAILENAGFSRVDLTRDLAGKDRVVSAVFSPDDLQ